MQVSGATQQLTSGRLLARNTVWNLVGLLTPMAVGLFAVPPLIRGLGVARFGVLSLAWIVIGYFSLFDLGIGRALTKLIADKLAQHEDRSIPPLAWTALLLMTALGSAGGLTTAALTPWLAHRALKVPLSLQSEALASFYLLAFSIPLVTLTSGLRGILEAQQRFRIVNLIRIPLSVFSLVSPLLVLPFSRNLAGVIAVLVVGRVIGTIIHFYACFRSMPGLRNDIRIDRCFFMPLVSFGGWMSVSNIVGPVMVYMDRFIISALLSVAAVAYYTAPFDMLTRIWVIPGAISSVLFPAFAMSLTQDRTRAALLLERGMKYVLLAIFPLVFMIIAFAPEGLYLWLGQAFVTKGSAALRWLAAGFLVNSLSQIPFGLIQSAGRPDITAKLHLIELPLYLGVVWTLTRHMGIEGTAIAWTLRVLLDSILICWCAQRLIRSGSRSMVALGATTAGGLIICYLSTLVANWPVRAVIVFLVLVAFASAFWFLALMPAERIFLSGIGGRVRGNGKIGVSES